MNKQRGFTLVELMISLVLFSFAVAGILSVAVTMTRSFREQRRLLAMEQSARAPLDFIVDSLRQASPGVPTGTIYNADGCGSGAIQLIDNTNAPDELEIVYASGGVVTTAHSAVTPSSTLITIPAIHLDQFATGDYVVVTDSAQGLLTQVTGTTGGLQINSTSCTAGFPGGSQFAARALVVRAQRARFLIENLDGVPTLWMDPDGAGLAEKEPIAEGVEDMQIALGIDTNADGAITEVGSAANDDEWTGNVAGDTLPVSGDIRAVRIVLVARDTTELQGTAGFYPITALNHTVSTTADKYRRRVLTSTVEIRNLLGSP